MEYSSYREAISNQTLFEAQKGQQLSGEILALGAGNVSPEGATIFRCAMDGANVLEKYPILSNWIGITFGGMAGMRPVINGWATQNAVKAEGATAALEQEEEKKKGLSKLLP